MKRIGIAAAIIFPLLAVGGMLALAQATWLNGQNATYVIGQADFTSNGSIPVSDTSLSSPKDVAVDAEHGKLYVLDAFNHRVLRYNYPITTSLPAADLVFGQPNYTTSTPTLARNGFNSPRGLTVDSTGRLWVSEYSNNRVVWFNQAYSLGLNQPDADGVLGQADFSSAVMTTTQSGMRHPYDLAVSADGALYVADADNNRVLRFDLAASKANGAPADGVLGQPDFTSAVITATQTGMATPRGVALAGDRLFVAERGNARVLRFDLAASKPNGAPADGVLGQSDFTSVVRSIIQAGMEYPSRLAVDGSGRLYVSDGFNADRVVVFVDAANKPNGAPADFVLGQPDFTSSGAALAQNRFNMDSSGAGLAVDTTGNLLLVADDNNNRVLLFQSMEPLGPPVLEISKRGPDWAWPGTVFTYTLTITNTGPVTATALVVNDSLPSGATYVGGGTLLPTNVISWTLPSLGPNGAAAEVAFSVSASQTVTNSVYSVTSAENVSASGLVSVVTEVERVVYLPLVTR